MRLFQIYNALCILYEKQLSKKPFILLYYLGNTQNIPIFELLELKSWKKLDSVENITLRS